MDLEMKTCMNNKFVTQKINKLCTAKKHFNYFTHNYKYIFLKGDQLTQLYYETQEKFNYQVWKSGKNTIDLDSLSQDV